MTRRMLAAAVLLLLVGAAHADRLVLRDGRSFTGTVTVRKDTVLVDMSYGTLEFSRDQVAHIDFADTPEAELAGMLADADPSDATELFQVAVWAEQNDLSRQAEDLYQQVLQLDSDHVGARRSLGYVRADGKWRPVDQALELARGKLEAGKAASLLKDLLPKLAAASADDEQRREIQRLTAHARVRSGRFSEAKEAFEQLSADAQPPRAARYAAIADLLANNEDGMYVLTETYPPQAGLLGNPGGVLTPGPASLSDPLVLAAALRDRAIEEIRRGRELMNEGRRLAASDSEKAQRRWLQASQAFDRADAMVEDIARSHRVELARQRITQLRRDVDSTAQQFDQTLESLGQEDLNARQYHSLLRGMIRRLDNVSQDLREIIRLTEPYPHELVLEAQWAQGDLEKVKSMRRTLTNELNGEK
ncbi:MAG: hypothetical protein ACLFVW_05190 [Phycisphaerae bacterium]